MANLRQIRRRIRSIQNIHGVTRAMEMVSGSRMRRAQVRLDATRPYIQSILDIVGRLANDAVRLNHPLVAIRPSRAIALVVLAGERGLCGAYNDRIIRQMEAAMRRASAPVKLHIIGRRGLEYARRHELPVTAQWTGIGVGVTRETTSRISRQLQEAFTSGLVDEVRIIRTRWAHGTYRVEDEQFLPLKKGQALFPMEDEEKGPGPFFTVPPYLAEPPLAELLKTLLPLACDLAFHRTILETLEAEHGARMLAMRLATDNASEMLDHLTLQRNKVRQAVITKELTEIVGGAEALKAS